MKESEKFERLMNELKGEQPLWDRINAVLNKYGQKYAQVSDINYEKKEVWVYGTGDKRKVIKALKELFGREFKVKFQ